jgi:hypothetical protein
MDHELACKLVAQNRTVVGDGLNPRFGSFGQLIKSRSGDLPLAPLQINHLPLEEPARKRSELALKRRTLAHTGAKRTAHLWHTLLHVD